MMVIVALRIEVPGLALSAWLWLAILLLVGSMPTQEILEPACCSVRLITPHTPDNGGMDHRNLYPHLSHFFADLDSHLFRDAKVPHQFIGAMSVGPLDFCFGFLRTSHIAPL